MGERLQKEPGRIVVAMFHQTGDNKPGRFVHGKTVEIHIPEERPHFFGQQPSQRLVSFFIWLDYGMSADHF
jgi:hypothetical protein